MLHLTARVARLGGDIERGRAVGFDTVCAIHEEPVGTSPMVEEGLHHDRAVRTMGPYGLEIVSLPAGPGPAAPVG